DLTRTYDGRFVGAGESGDVSSEAFKFRPCGSLLQLGTSTEPLSDSLLRYTVVVRAEMPRPLAGVAFAVGGEDVFGRPCTQASRPMELVSTDPRTGVQVFRQTFLGPPGASCPLPKGKDPLVIMASATDIDGRVYGDDGACWQLSNAFPTCRGGQASFDLSVTQEFPSCAEAAPARLARPL